jgi:hypothetical protein
VLCKLATITKIHEIKAAILRSGGATQQQQGMAICGVIW